MDIKMTPEQMQKILDNAPKGATHYDIEYDYLRLHESRWSVWDSFNEVWRPIYTPTEEAVIIFSIKTL